MTKNSVLFLAFICVAALFVPAQSNRTKKTVRPATDTAPAAAVTPPVAAPTPGKRNGRPDTSASVTPAKVLEPSYLYEFSRPGFAFSRILIEHDTAGRGKASFARDGSDELFTDPLELTPVTLQNINDSLTKLDFLNSSETYQTERDYSTMGNVTFTYKSGGRQRTVKYNWSDNKDAKALMDEYRRIGNEATWRFELLVARENQPLQTPGLLDTMANYLNRGEISDPPHLIPLLTQLADDERLPLMARNHAARLVKSIKKLQR